jgi:hypothetical protein
MMWRIFIDAGLILFGIGLGTSFVLWIDRGAGPRF